MSVTITEVDFGDMPDEELKPIVELANTLDKEAQPRSSAMSVDEFRAFTALPGFVHSRFLAHDDSGRLVGMAAARYNDDGSNADQLHCSIRVATEYRRRGFGGELLRVCAELAASVDRNRMMGFCIDTVPSGLAFSERLGAEVAMEMHMNVLRVADIDEDLMRAWVELGRERASGYSVTVYEGRWPEEILDNMAKLYLVIDRDSPQPEGHEAREWTGELVSQFLDQLLPSCDSLMAYACHDESGEPAGMSHLIRRHSDPTTWIVTTTMVEPSHRGRSIGKWVKGRVNLAALDSWEGGIYQETSNAFTNDAMLAINDAMGFRHEFTATLVETSLADVQEYLAGR